MNNKTRTISALFFCVLLIAVSCSGCIGSDDNSSSEPTTQAPTTQAPTTQAPTTQAPTTQAGFGRNNPIPMGQTLSTTDGYEITVLDIIKGPAAWDILLNANPFNDAPEAEMQYVLIKVKVKNISSEEEPGIFHGFRCSVIGSSDRVYHKYDKSVVLPFEGTYTDLGLAGDVSFYHGDEEAGYIPFYILSNETNMVMIYQPLSSENDEEMRFFSLE